MFNCTHCKYSTKYKCNYIKHTETKKHKKIIYEIMASGLQNEKVYKPMYKNNSEPVQTRPNPSEVNIAKSNTLYNIITTKLLHLHKKEITLLIGECIYCGLCMSHNRSLPKHFKSCQVKINYDKFTDIININKVHENKIIDNVKLIKGLKSKIKSLEKDVEFYQKTLNDSKVIVKGNLSAFAFINKNYTKTPVLTKPNFKLLKGFKEIGDKGQPKFIENMVYKFINKIAHEEIGDIICDYYKKDDPKLQSLWVTDPSRNSYVIRSKVNDNTLWVKDRGGNDSRQLTIDPVIVKLKKQLINYQKTLQKEISKESNERKMSLDTIIEHLKKSSDFIEEIKKNEFQKKVLDYLSPKLSIDTTNNDKLLEEK